MVEDPPSRLPSKGSVRAGYVACLYLGGIHPDLPFSSTTLSHLEAPSDKCGLDACSSEFEEDPG